MLTKREVILIVTAPVIAAALTVWGTIFVVDRFVLGRSDDPLAKVLPVPILGGLHHQYVRI
jgi:hypothetical protein